MKKIILPLMALVFTSAVYADSETSNSATVEHSKNPITGSKTTTKKWKNKKRNGDAKAESTTTEKVKENSDGTKERSTDTKTDSK
jgi:hypothetical protein